MHIEDRLSLLERRVAALEGTSGKALPNGFTRKIRVIEDTVSREFGVPVTKIRGQDRHAFVVWARQVMHTIACRVLGIDESAAARLFGVDRGTIRHSRKVVRDQCDVSPRTREDIRRIAEEISELL